MSVIDFGKAKQKLEDNKEQTQQEREEEIMERANREYVLGEETAFSNYRKSLSLEVINFIMEKFEEREKMFKDIAQSFDVIDVLNHGVDYINEQLAELAVKAYRDGEIKLEDIPQGLHEHLPEDILKELSGQRMQSLEEALTELFSEGEEYDK